MADAIFFYLNGQPVTVAGTDVFETVANFVRYRMGATGTKLVCEEGDCGACSVLVGRPTEDGIEYKPINSCIQFIYQIAGAHVVTVEGLRRGSDMHPVQDAMVRCHGAQCGFCTPGFVVAMCGMFESGSKPEERDVRNALTGNLCRCTGYEPIIKAALSVDRTSLRTLNELYPPDEISSNLRAHSREPVRIDAQGRKFFAPTTIAEAAKFKNDNPGAVIVQGATDVGVWHNKRGFRPDAILNLSRIPELSSLTVEAGQLIAGANVTLGRIEPLLRERVPELYDIFLLFGAPQIKNAATLAGNIANASPIADTLPFLYVMDAQLELTGTRGSRSTPISSFYLGYKKLDLRTDEIISRISVPLPAAGDMIKLYKVSKRKNLDISTVTAAFRIEFSRSRVQSAKIAVGGVGPTVIRLSAVEAFLRSKDFGLKTLRAAGEMARREIAPITDVRGSAEFRSQLIENLFSKLYYDLQEARVA